MTTSETKALALEALKGARKVLGPSATRVEVAAFAEIITEEALGEAHPAVRLLCRMRLETQKRALGIV